MKKTFPANINGKIYQIDEDAYQLLQNYLSQLRDAFPGEEGSEIVGDIECRISEHFDQRFSEGVSVIVIDDVNRVIAIMGRPEDISEQVDFDVENDTTAARPKPFTEQNQASASEQNGFSDNTNTTPPVYKKKLFRDERHKVFGGVLAGVAQYLGWDVTILRIFAVVIALSAVFCHDLFWPSVIAYMVAWMVIPPAVTPRQILEMKGEPVTVDSVGRTVIDNSQPPIAPVPEGSSTTNTINNIFLAIGRVILVIIGLVAGFILFITCLCSLALIGYLIFAYFFSNADLSDMIGLPFTTNYTEAWGFTMALLAVALPAFAVCRVGIGSLFNKQSFKQPTMIVLAVLEVIFIVAAVILLNY